MFRRTRLDTHPVIASLTLSRLDLGPYSRDGEEDERDDLSKEHRGQRDGDSMERSKDREKAALTECQLLSHCLWGEESSRSRAWQMKEKQSNLAFICGVMSGCVMISKLGSPRPLIERLLDGEFPKHKHCCSSRPCEYGVPMLAYIHEYIKYSVVRMLSLLGPEKTVLPLPFHSKSTVPLYCGCRTETFHGPGTPLPDITGL